MHVSAPSWIQQHLIAHQFPVPPCNFSNFTYSPTRLQQFNSGERRQLSAPKIYREREREEDDGSGGAEQARIGECQGHASAPRRTSPGGFPPFRYARRIPNVGSSAMAIFLAAFGAFSWGMYQVGQGNKKRRALKEEKCAAQKAILPMLQAEEDDRFVKDWRKYLEEEAKIMKNVPGWKVGENVYDSGRWMPPATGELRPDIW